MTADQLVIRPPGLRTRPLRKPHEFSIRRLPSRRPEINVGSRDCGRAAVRKTDGFEQSIDWLGRDFVEDPVLIDLGGNAERTLKKGIGLEANEDLPFIRP